MYNIRFTKRANKDAQKLKRAGLDANAKALLDVMREDPFGRPPAYEKLVGDLRGFYSRRINIQHRLVYSVDTQKQEIIVLRLWGHYE